MHCPNEGTEGHPGEGEFLFVVMALVRVDAGYEVQSVMEFLAEPACGACGEEAVVDA